MSSEVVTLGITNLNDNFLRLILKELINQQRYEDAARIRGMIITLKRAKELLKSD